MKQAWNTLKRLHSDEKGAQGLEMLLIIAAIVLPLLGILIIFKNAVIGAASAAWNKIAGQTTTTDPQLDSPGL